MISKNNNLAFKKKKTQFKLFTEKYSLDLKKINQGLNDFNDFFIFRNKNNIKVYDRVCDHSGGKLIKKNSTNEIICPLHGWEFDPSTGSYLNIKLKKKEINFIIKNQILSFILEKQKPVFFNNKKDLNLEIQFINHACLVFKTKNLKFAIDPWVFGPAFLTGWWLKKKSPKNSISELNDCDFIYISHNHPDHLHDLTLSKIRKNQKFLVPNFASKSVEKYLISLGKTNITTIDFGFEYQLEKNSFLISPLKSGDFRDDSGIYFSIGKFNAILAVDANSLNFLNLPSQITFLASSFAGGASGYPVCFENYSQKKKKEIIERNNKSLIIRNKKLLSTTKPKFYMPYAGFFSEDAIRDKKIKRLNKKITIEEYDKVINKKTTELLNLNLFQIYNFKGEHLINNTKNDRDFNDLSNIKYIKLQKKLFKKINKKKIIEYFSNSKFKSNLKIFISLTSDNFKTNFISFSVEFFEEKPKVVFFKKKNLFLKKFEAKKYNIINFKIRADSFLSLIKNMLPWEDLLIGFQMRIKRFPDVYNIDFWYHFTNIYVKSSRKSSISQCNYCERINQTLNSINN